MILNCDVHPISASIQKFLMYTVLADILSRAEAPSANNGIIFPNSREPRKKNSSIPLRAGNNFDIVSDSNLWR